MALAISYNSFLLFTVDYQGLELKARGANVNNYMSDGKEERVGSPDTNAKTNCSSGPAGVSYEGRNR